jgi:hypothetical protein
MTSFNKRNKAEVMAGVKETVVKSKIVGSSTVEYFTETHRCVRYHETDVVRENLKTGEITLNSDGWKTPTTKKRINDFQNIIGIFQEKGIWYCVKNKRYNNLHKNMPFYDGIKFTKRGRCLKIKKNEINKTAEILKMIDAYCDKLKKEGYPEPSTGDCFICTIVSHENILKNTEHIKSHLKEKYIHGSFITLTLLNAGYKQSQIPYVSRIDDFVLRAVRKIFKQVYGIAV